MLPPSLVVDHLFAEFFDLCSQIIRQLLAIGLIPHQRSALDEKLRGELPEACQVVIRVITPSLNLTTQVGDALTASSPQSCDFSSELEKYVPPFWSAHPTHCHPVCADCAGLIRNGGDETQPRSTALLRRFVLAQGNRGRSAFREPPGRELRGAEKDLDTP